MSWLRWEAEYDRDPDILKAGWQAAVTFERVCRLVKRFGNRGHIKTKYICAAYISEETKVPLEIIEPGLLMCIKNKLIIKEEDGFYVSGWLNYQPDPTNADRQAAFKKRNKVTEVTVTHVSNGSNDDGTLQDSTVQDKKIKRDAAKEKNLPQPLVDKTNQTQHIKKTRYDNFFDDLFWPAYPARNGKKLLKADARRFLERNVRELDFDLLITATKNYTESELVQDGIGIKDAARWLKNWREWIEPEVRQPKGNGKKPSGNPFLDMLKEGVSD